MPEVIPFGLCKSAVPDARSAIRAKLYSQPKWLELVRHASDDYVALALRYRASCREARLAECQLAAEVLATGRFSRWMSLSWFSFGASALRGLFCTRIAQTASMVVATSNQTAPEKRSARSSLIHLS